MEYRIDSLITFVKVTNLEKWYMHNGRKHSEAERMEYAKARSVYLVVQAHFEAGHTYVSIKCPINPLPVKGWFETPSINVLKKSLEAFGWEHLITHASEVLK